MTLPKDLRLIQLQYDGRCASCGRGLAAGERTHWSQSARKLWCVDCVDPPGPPADEWERLCRYARLCVEAEAARSLAPFAKRDADWFFHSGTEELIIGASDSTAAPAGMAAALDALAERSEWRSIIYGWPMVVVIDRNQPKVAPLFVVEAEHHGDTKADLQLHAAGETEFNRAIIATDRFDPVDVDEILRELGEDLPFGDAEATTTLAIRAAELLGLPILTPLNPGALSTSAGRRPGIYNAAISVLTEVFAYDKYLIDELRDLEKRADWADTAAAHLFRRAPTPNDTSKRRERKRSRLRGPLAAPLPCNQTQEETLSRFRAEPLTVVTGPPGTGKTQLVVNAVANAWLDGESVLVTSTNNAAVDVAVHRAVRDVGPGLLIRTGNRTARKEVPARVTAAADKPMPDPARQAAARAGLQHSETERAKLAARLARLDELEARLLRLVKAGLRAREARRKWTGEVWSTGMEPNELPLDLREIARRALGALRSRCFRGIQAWSLRRRIDCVGTASVEAIFAWALWTRRHAALAQSFASAQTERAALRKAVGDPSTTLQTLNEEWAVASLDAIRTEIAARVRSEDDRVATIGGASASGTRFRRPVAKAIEVLRGWGCTTLSAHANFPLAAGLFDLVIVDEASQCSLAAVLPLAYRARRLAVVGDPNQLPPIVARLRDGMLERFAKETELDSQDLRKRGLHHKDGSAYFAFESAAEPTRPTLLDEHYRCHPRIARWFNRAFYNERLKILTDLDPAGRQRTIAWQDVAGVAERPGYGRSWVNRAEAGQTVAQLEALLARDDVGTVGVVTPFRAQAALIERLANERLAPADLMEADFACGTAHRLQGNERDAIILSVVLSPDAPRGTVSWVERERNLLNVAVSRARSTLIVLGHPAIGDLASPTLASLRAYLRDVAAKQTDGIPVATFRIDSEAENRLLRAMQNARLLPLGKLDVEGYELDFALMERGIRLNIEVDGDQHRDARGRQRRQDLARDLVLDRLGWTVLRFPAWRCYAEMPAVLDEITRARDLLFEGVEGERGSAEPGAGGAPVGEPKKIR